MRNKIFMASIFLAAAVFSFYACDDSQAGGDNKKNETKISDGSASTAYTPAQVERGSHLVLTMVCDDCHSPKRLGPQGVELIPELRLSGFRQDGQLPPLDTQMVKNGWNMFAPDLTASVGPWGASFAANLTPDATGIGSWKEEQFFKAIRHGISKGLDGNRPLLPPMPWQSFSKLSDEDLRSIFAYLKSIKPVHNVVPAPKSLSALVAAR
ncbi:MAG: c-type cytochrome [Chitinophagaceae bacterium]|nr:c-type cytochrome [Chitinophagaceae bacterium]